MKVKQFKLVSNTLILGSFVVMATSGLSLYSNSKSFKNYAQLMDGMQICFNRVSQSYTAEIIGDTESNYRSKDFHQKSEECFGEMINFLETQKFNSETVNSKALNTLSSNIHWFHQKMESVGEENKLTGGIDGGFYLHLGTRFEELEIAKEEIVSEIDAEKNHLSNLQDRHRLIFSWAIFLAPFLMLINWLLSAGRRKENLEIEKEAKREWDENKAKDHNKVEYLVEKALQVNSFHHLEKIFYSYKARKVENVDLKKNSKSKFMIPRKKQVALDETLAKNAKLDKIWQDESLAINIDHKSVLLEANTPKKEVAPRIDGIDLNKALASTIKKMEKELQASGIVMDLDVKDIGMVDGHSEEIEQILYQVMSYNCQGITKRADSKLIAIKGRNIDDKTYIDIYDGERIGPDFAKKLGQDQASLPLLIVRELADDSNVHFNVVSVQNSDGKDVGKKISLIFDYLGEVQEDKVIPAKASDKKSLVRLEKGTKRELREKGILR